MHRVLQSVLGVGLCFSCCQETPLHRMLAVAGQSVCWRRKCLVCDLNQKKLVRYTAESPLRALTAFSIGLLEATRL